MQSTSARTGQLVRCYVTPKPFWAFVPEALPPKPALTIDQETQELMSRVRFAAERLSGMGSILGDESIIRNATAVCEASQAARLSNKQSSLAKLLVFLQDETPGIPRDEEATLAIAAKHLRAHNYILNNEVNAFTQDTMKTVYGFFAATAPRGRGIPAAMGQAAGFRRVQNWVGGRRPTKAKFVPAPPEALPGCMNALEDFAQNNDEYQPIVKAALLHAQFSMLMPFEEFNTRTGLVLTYAHLKNSGIIEEPTCVISEAFGRKRNLYDAHIKQLITEGAWENWIKFYASCIAEAAEKAAARIQKIQSLFENDHEQILGLGRATESAIKIHDYIKSNMILSIPKAACELKISQPTVTGSVEHLCRLGVLKEITGKQRNRIYAYDGMIAILQGDV